MTNQLPQVPRSQTVLCDDSDPGVRVILEVGCHARWHVRPGLDTERFSQGRPQTAPFEHVAIGDVERLVRGLGRLCSPDHHVGNQIRIGGFPDE